MLRIKKSFYRRIAEELGTVRFVEKFTKFPLFISTESNEHLLKGLMLYETPNDVCPKIWFAPSVCFNNEMHNYMKFAGELPSLSTSDRLKGTLYVSVKQIKENEDSYKVFVDIFNQYLPLIDDIFTYSELISLINSTRAFAEAIKYDVDILALYESKTFDSLRFLNSKPGPDVSDDTINNHFKLLEMFGSDISLCIDKLEELKVKNLELFSKNHLIL